MRSLFERGLSLRTRLLVALGIASTLMFLDHRLNTMQPVRSFLNTVVAPVQYLAVLPELIVLRKLFGSSIFSSALLTCRESFRVLSITFDGAGTAISFSER